MEEADSDGRRKGNKNEKTNADEDLWSITPIYCPLFSSYIRLFLLIKCRKFIPGPGALS